MTALEQKALETQIAKDKALLELIKALKYQVENYDLGIRLIVDAIEKLSTSTDNIEATLADLGASQPES